MEVSIQERITTSKPFSSQNLELKFRNFPNIPVTIVMEDVLTNQPKFFIHKEQESINTHFDITTNNKCSKVFFFQRNPR